MRRTSVARISTCSNRPASAEMAAGGIPVRSASSRSVASSRSSAANSETMYSETLSTWRMPNAEWLLFDADVPGLLEILLRIRAERGQRLCPLNGRHFREALGHDLGDLLVLRHLDD